jgi:hypothetical protein
LIDAETAVDAKNWGDHLARSYAARNPDNLFLLSEEVTTVDDPAWKGVTDWSGPITTRSEAADEHIGW